MQTTFLTGMQFDTLLINRVVIIYACKCSNASSISLDYMNTIDILYYFFQIPDQIKYYYFNIVYRPYIYYPRIKRHEFDYFNHHK